MEEIEQNQFPIGLKVLAIDANIVCLKYLVQLLTKCQYKVTATTEATEAVRLLKDEKQRFDIIITNVVRSDMDGFKILQTIIGLKIDIPVVMVSANEELEMAKRGVMEGAEAYLLKPVSLSELRNLWQHVLRRRSANPNFKEEKIQQISHEKVTLISKELDDDISVVVSSSTSSKKRRVAWTKILHDKFLAAYEQLGEKERVPNNILKLMNDPSLSREQIASHLQKHRDMQRKNKRNRVEQKNYHVRNSNLMPQLSKFGSSSSIMEQFQGNKNYFPVPEFKWFNNLIPKPCDQHMGFGRNNNVNPQYSLAWESKYLNPAPPTFGNYPIGTIPDQAPPLAWTFSSNNNNSNIAGQYSQMKLDKGDTPGNLLLDDEIHELLKQFQSDEYVVRFDVGEI